MLGVSCHHGRHHVVMARELFLWLQFDEMEGKSDQARRRLTNRGEWNNAWPTSSLERPGLSIKPVRGEFKESHCGAQSGCLAAGVVPRSHRKLSINHLSLQSANQNVGESFVQEPKIVGPGWLGLFEHVFILPDPSAVESYRPPDERGHAGA